MSRAVYHIARDITLYQLFQSVTIIFNHISFAIFSQYNSVILFIYRLLACKSRFTRNLSSVYQALRRKNGMQYRQDEIFLTLSEMLYFLDAFIKQD